MMLVDTIESKDERRSQERAAIEVYVPKSDMSRPAPILVRTGQHLDVDGILERSLPKTLSQYSYAKP